MFTKVNANLFLVPILAVTMLLPHAELYADPATSESGSISGSECTHFFPPGRACYLGGEGSDRECFLPPSPNLEYKGLKGNDWHPSVAGIKRQVDVTFIFRGYGNSSLFAGQDDFISYRSKHLKQVIMSALSEITFGEVKHFQ